jgi:hypothetical protein
MYLENIMYDILSKEEELLSLLDESVYEAIISIDLDTICVARVFSRSSITHRSY